MADIAPSILWCLSWFHSQKYPSFMRHRERKQLAKTSSYHMTELHFDLRHPSTGSTLLTKMLRVWMMCRHDGTFFEEDQDHRFCKEAKEELDIRCQWSLKIQLLERGEWSGLSWLLTSYHGLGVPLGARSGDHWIHMARHFILPWFMRGGFHPTSHHFKV